MLPLGAADIVVGGPDASFRLEDCEGVVVGQRGRLLLLSFGLVTGIVSLSGCGGGGGGSSAGPTLPTLPLPGEMRSESFRCETAIVSWGGGATASASYRALVTVGEPSGTALDENHIINAGFAATILDRP